MKKLSNKRAGISLVALIITIIVLIILTAAVIITFMDGGIVDRAKQAVFKNDMRTYQEILVAKRGEKQIDREIGTGEETYETTSDPNKIKEIIPEFKDEYAGVVAIENYELVQGALVSVENPEGVYANYKLWLTQLGIGVGTSSETGETIEKQWTLTTDTGDEGLSIGDLVSCGGEDFYVIGFSNNDTIVNLLAKYNLTLDGSEQDSTGESNPCIFCSSEAWTAETAYDLENLNNRTLIQEDSTSALYKAIEYGKSLGGTGRIMLKSEAVELQTSYSTILYGQYATGNYLDFWLGSANNVNGRVWSVFGESSNLGSNFCYYHQDRYYGVRPVIEISLSLVQ